MGVDSYAYIISQKNVNKLPLPFQEYIKDNMQEITLDGQTIYVQCGIELDEYFWDQLELDESEKREIVTRLLEDDGCWSIEECKEDYESDRAYIDACVENFTSSNILEYVENFVPELIQIVSDFD